MGVCYKWRVAFCGRLQINGPKYTNGITEVNPAPCGFEVRLTPFVTGFLKAHKGPDHLKQQFFLAEKPRRYPNEYSPLQT